MIEYLNEDWDDAIENCFKHCGPGFAHSLLSPAMLHLIEDMVNDCCEVISKNKGVKIKAEFKTDIVNIAELKVYVVFSVFDPIEKLKRKYSEKRDGESRVAIKLPSFSTHFNAAPDFFYKETITALWDGYRDYMKGKFNYLF